MKLGWAWAGAAGATLQTPKEEEGGGRGGSEDSKGLCSDARLSCTSPVLLQGRNVGPGCGCTRSDLNLKSPGLILHAPVLLSATDLSTGRALGSLDRRMIPGKRGLTGAEMAPRDNTKFRAELGSIAARFPLQVHLVGDVGLPSWRSQKSPAGVRPFTGWSAVRTGANAKAVRQPHLMQR